MRALTLALTLLAALLAGCASQPTQTRSDNAVAPSVPAADLSTFGGFGEALQNSMIGKDTGLFVERMDAELFARRSLASLGARSVKQETVDNYARVMDKALKNRFKQTFNEVKSAHFVRLMPQANAADKDRAVALIRILPEDGGINYWKVYLQRVDGEIRITDWFSYSMGDLASRSLGSFLLQVGIAALKPDSPVAHGVNTYLAASRSGDPQRQLDAFKTLPANLKRNSLLMFARVQAANKVSEAAYRDVLSDLAPQYRTSDNYALLLVDYYLHTEEYDKAHQAIDVVAKNIGDDAGLDNLHASIALLQKDYNGAIAYARDGIDRENTYEDNYWVLLDALVFTQRYADAVLVLNILEDGFSYSFDAEQMATLEGYEGFAHSDAFRGWQSAAVQ